MERFGKVHSLFCSFGLCLGLCSGVWEKIIWGLAVMQEVEGGRESTEQSKRRKVNGCCGLKCQERGLS